MMDEELILSLVKDRLGLRSTVRNGYIAAIIKGVISELEEEKGLALNSANFSHVMFIVDYSTWYYQNRDNTGGLPRHLQFRLHNLIISNIKVGVEDGV